MEELLVVVVEMNVQGVLVKEQGQQVVAESFLQKRV